MEAASQGSTAAMLPTDNQYSRRCDELYHRDPSVFSFVRRIWGSEHTSAARGSGRETTERFGLAMYREQPHPNHPAGKFNEMGSENTVSDPEVTTKQLGIIWIDAKERKKLGQSSCSDFGGQRSVRHTRLARDGHRLRVYVYDIEMW